MQRLVTKLLVAYTVIQPSLVFTNDAWQGSVPEKSANEARGNWYLKRQYVRSARQEYTAIQEKGDAVEKQRDTFVKKRDTIMQDLWSFYSEQNIDVGHMLERIQTVKQWLEQERSEDVELSEEERQWLQEADSYKKSLDKVKNYLTSLQKLHDGLDKALQVFEDQLNQVDSYEQKAWQLYEEIAKTVSDDVAEKKYWELKGIRANAQQIVDYIKNDFSNFFSEKVKEIQSYMQGLKQYISELEKKGISLRKDVKKALEEEEQQEKKADEQGDQAKDQKKQEGSQAEQDQKQATSEQTGYFTVITTWIHDTAIATYDALYNGIASIGAYVGITEDQPEKANGQTKEDAQNTKQDTETTA